MGYNFAFKFSFEAEKSIANKQAFEVKPWAYPGFLEGGFRSIKRELVFNFLPDFS